MLLLIGLDQALHLTGRRPRSLQGQLPTSANVGDVGNMSHKHLMTHGKEMTSKRDLVARSF